MSSGFVSENALEEKRKKRQEEWEKVRKPEDPVEAPEEEYDSRSLFDRLKEQKDKKQAEWDEAHKLKNLVRGLDDDEVGFLDLVDKTKLAEESRILKEEKEELEEYRKAVATLAEQSTEERLRTEVKLVPSSSSRGSRPTQPSIGVLCKGSQQSKLLANIVKRKSPGDDMDNSKRLKTGLDVEVKTKNNLQCIAVLPGIGCYDGSSDSESNSDSDDEVCAPLNANVPQFDLCGRPLQSQHEAE